MIRIDLHIHSTCSDGKLTPFRLVALAKKSKVSVLSLTDHDSVDGVKDFLTACKKEKISGVSGVEFSADYPGVLHILGYRFNVDKINSDNAFRWIRESRKERNTLIFSKLREIGIDITIDEVNQEACGDILARPHFARVLVRKGYSRDVAAAFRDYVGETGRAYVPRARIDPVKCVELIRNAGGLPVIAHPILTSSNIQSLYELLLKLKDAGLWGIECYSSHHTSSQIFECLKLAQKCSLVPTAGTDFHTMEQHSLGVRVPDDFLPWGRFCGGLC